MNAFQLSRLFAVDFLRHRLNCLLLVCFPVVFVLVSADALTDFARVLGGHTGHNMMGSFSAAWAGAISAGLGTYFSTSRTRGADHLVDLRTARWDISIARLALFALVGAGCWGSALAALRVCTDVNVTLQIAVGTGLLVGTYGCFGAIVGSLVHDELTGSLALVGVWMLDVFLGPAMGGGSLRLAALVPSRPSSEVIMSGVDGFPTALLGGIVWLSLSLIASFVLLDRQVAHAAVAWTRAKFEVKPVGQRDPGRHPVPVGSQDSRPIGRPAAELTRSTIRTYARNRILLLVLLATPVTFVGVSFFMFTGVQVQVPAAIDNQAVLLTMAMPKLHGAYMGYMTVSFLSAVAGLFVVIRSREADSRLIVSGYRRRSILIVRLLTVAAASCIVSLAALLVGFCGFRPENYGLFVVAYLLGSVTWGCIGAAFAPVLGRVGGTLCMLLLPFLDVGIAQDYMLGPQLPAWSENLPSAGSVQVLIDSAFSTSFHSATDIALAGGWLLGAVAAATGVLLLSLRTIANSSIMNGLPE
ncbi:MULTISPECIES: hypothetical protein [unclassified Frankia]|uniref:hypothetical protein n=1 Tax=unclassified Frankia TaxID=2632575 RepID=UPI002024145A